MKNLFFAILTSAILFAPTPSISQAGGSSLLELLPSRLIDKATFKNFTENCINAADSLKKSFCYPHLARTRCAPNESGDIQLLCDFQSVRCKKLPGSKKCEDGYASRDNSFCRPNSGTKSCSGEVATFVKTIDPCAKVKNLFQRNDCSVEVRPHCQAEHGIINCKHKSNNCRLSKNGECPSGYTPLDKGSVCKKTSTLNNDQKQRSSGSINGEG